MARCEDCLHYNLCVDTETRHLKIILIGDKAERCKQFMSTTDVVPKSEVEKLEAELDDLKRDTVPKLQWSLQRANAMGRDLEVELEAMRGAANSYKMHYEKAKSEVAREIFEEIEKHLVFNPYGVALISQNNFRELKKKYTEVEHEP